MSRCFTSCYTNTREITEGWRHQVERKLKSARKETASQQTPPPHQPSGQWNSSGQCKGLDIPQQSWDERNRKVSAAYQGLLPGERFR